MAIDLKESTLDELLALRANSTSEMLGRLDSYLDGVAAAYVEVLGQKEGMERFIDHVFQRCAQRHYPDGWPGLVRYAIKISG